MFKFLIQKYKTFGWSYWKIENATMQTRSFSLKLEKKWSIYHNKLLIDCVTQIKLWILLRRNDVLNQNPDLIKLSSSKQE